MAGRGKRKMPHTHCQAFKRSGRPCTARLRTDLVQHGLCGTHCNHIGNELLTERFNREQAIYREAWLNRRQAAVAPAPTETAAPAVRGPCGQIMTGGRVCNRISAGHDDGKCSLHHGLLVRRAAQQPMVDTIALVRRIYRHGATIAEVDEIVNRRFAEVPHGNYVQATINNVDNIVIAPYENQMNQLLNHGRTIEDVHAQIMEWQRFGVISERRGEILVRNSMVMLRHVQWRRAWDLQHPPAAPAQRFGPNQREAQLAADSQNVHTKEISAQMRDSLAMLVAVAVPETQTNTCQEIRECWNAQGNRPAEVGAVYNDVVEWWNRKTIFNTDDKLYKKCLRGLWWTIKQYNGETRKELEKRLWQECKEAALPYSVCVQGHMARLSNVMVGFDEAFVPPVPVGEILQQKMAAISEMNISYEKQIQMAEELLAELKVPVEQHGNWLAAF